MQGAGHAGGVQSGAGGAGGTSLWPAGRRAEAMPGQAYRSGARPATKYATAAMGAPPAWSKPSSDTLSAATPTREQTTMTTMTTTPRITVIQIIAQGLKDRGFDGLHSGDGCGCLADTLAPCGESPTQCQPGFRGRPVDRETDWAIYSTKELAEASKLTAG